MEIEQIFAAAVLNASGMDQIADSAGVPQSACDQVVGALADLWVAGRAAGMSGTDIQAIADHHVCWDEEGDPWPQEMPPNLRPFRR